MASSNENDVNDERIQLLSGHTEVPGVELRFSSQPHLPSATQTHTLKWEPAAPTFGPAATNAKMNISRHKSTIYGNFRVLETLMRPSDYPGMGSSIRVERLNPIPITVKPMRLGTLAATAIAGNDLLSSVLYTAGICSSVSGKYAPLCVLMVCLLLRGFQSIYAEVGSAFPLNGGAYNVLLNTSSKLTAASVACLSILSYLATALVSAASAVEYLSEFTQTSTETNFVLVIGLLLGCCLISLCGLTESASVAAAIFVCHCVTLIGVVLLCGWQIYRSGLNQLWANLADDSSFGIPQSGVSKSIFYGFSAALLGCTGFETTCNYIEDQKPGVFPATLRNLWVLVLLFNPTLCLLILAIVPLPAMKTHSSALLAHTALLAGGEWAQKAVVLDGFIVLTGSVLTAYVGVTGLVERLCHDRCLPRVLLSRAPVTQTSFVIIIGFFMLCLSHWVLASSALETLAGVYAMSFLAVLALIAIANMLLKYTRAPLRRSPITSWPTVTFALVGVMVGLIGNVQMRPEIVLYFVLYFGGVLLIILVMFFRIRFLEMLAFFTEGAKDPIISRVDRWVRSLITDINSLPFVFFTKTNALHILNKAALYCMENEQTHRLYIAHIHAPDNCDDEFLGTLEQNVATLDLVYPKTGISSVVVPGDFTPELVEALAQLLDVPKNCMFIACPGHKNPLNLREFGGVRMIMHAH